jgi:predicted transcriptional regulator
MAAETAPSKIIDTLSQRIRFIECLLDGPKDKQEFVEELDVSRSTVDRAVRELEALEFIEYRNASYCLTLYGQLVVQEYQAFESSIEEVCAAQTSNEPTVSKAIDVITQRIGFTECLLDGLLDKRGLVERLDISRSTVDRGTRNLEVFGLIEYQNGSFTLTEHGREATRGYQRLENLLENFEEMSAFLRWIPESEFDLDLAQLADGDIVLPEPGDPLAMVNRHVQVLKQMDDARIILPLTGLHAMETLHERITQADAQSEVVVAPAVAEMFQSNPDYVELFEGMVDTGRFEVYVCGSGIPYYLGIFGRTVQIGVDENGEPRGLLETDSEEVREWAERKYDSCKQEAEVLS